MLSRIFFLCLSLWLLGCSTPSQPFAVKDAEAVGQIIDLKTNQPISVTDLIAQLTAQDYILIGEEHDQRIHHQIELFLFNQLSQITKVNLLALEMLNVEQQLFIDEIQANQHLSLSDYELQKAIQWKNWDWSMYGDLIVAGLGSQAHLIATNLTDIEVSTLLKGAEPLKGTISVSDRVKQSIANLLTSHHNPYPIENMVAVQQFRDRRMAEKLVKNAASMGVLIAGNHHVNKEIGVPLHISEYDKTKKVTVLMLKTEREGVTSSQADYLWLTK